MGDAVLSGWSRAQKCHLILIPVHHTVSHPHQDGALAALARTTS